jgi:hypothetical protein
MIDGAACATCGRYLGESVGYPRTCVECDAKDNSEGSKRKRASNRVESNRILREAGYFFEECNHGAHLIVQTIVGRIDFWPGTGKFIVASTKHSGRGVFNLMKHAVPLVPEPESKEIQWKPHMSRFAVNTYAAAGYIVVGEPERSE